MYSDDNKITTNICQLQSDVLLEDTTKNPLFKKSAIATANKSLNTKSKSVVSAINELLKRVNSIESNVTDALNKQFSVIGDAASDTELSNRLHKIAPNIIEGLSKINDNIQEIAAFAADDFEDTFSVTTTAQSEFKLTHTPIGKVRLYIDGIRYFKTCYTYDSTANTIRWTFTAANGGFDIQDADVVLEYDYIAEK